MKKNDISQEIPDGSRYFARIAGIRSRNGQYT